MKSASIRVLVVEHTAPPPSCLSDLPQSGPRDFLSDPYEVRPKWVSEEAPHSAEEAGRPPWALLPSLEEPYASIVSLGEELCCPGGGQCGQSAAVSVSLLI